MKKVVLVLLVTLLVLTGCSGDKKPSGESVELTFWAHQNEPWNASYQEIIDAFEKENDGVKIKLETFPYDEFESKVQTSLINKEGGADIYELWGGWAIDFAKTGALAAIPDKLEGNIRDDVYKPTIGALEYKDNLYGLPLEFNIENGGMLVNLGLLKEAGLKVPTTWSELKETAKAGSSMKNNIFEVKGFDFVNWDSVPYLFTSMILSKGGNYLNDDGTFNVTSPIAIEAFTELYNMVNVEKLTDLEGLTGGGELEGYQSLYANKVMMVPRGPWAISEGLHSFDLKLGEDFDYVAMPWYGSEKKFASETGWSLAVNENTKNKEIAFKFLEFMYQDEILLAHNIKSTQVPAKKSVAHNAELIKSMPYLGVLIDILDGSQFIGYFNTDEFKESINNTFVDLSMGKHATVEEALKSLNETLNSILD